MLKKFIRKSIGLLLITSLLISGSNYSAVAEAKAVNSGKIRAVTLANAGAGTTQSYKSKAFIYVPANVDVSNRPGTAPVLVVYGDKDFTDATALKTADSSGLGKIAADEECIILFVNSIGDNWSEADKGSLSAVYTTYSISSNKVYPDGISKDGFFPGFPARTYVFAEGSGADFVAKYLVKGVDTQDYLTPNVIPFKPTGVILDNVKEPVITAGTDEVAAYIINGTKDIYDTFVKLDPNCKKVGQQTSKIKNGFDKDALLSGYDNVVSTAIRLERNTIVNVPKYAKLGITEKREYVQHFDTKIEYYSYVPDNLKNSAKGTIPLVFLFHGYDASAEQQAWLSEWPIIGKENGFMVVSVNRHTNYTPALMEELLNYVKKEYPMIDSSKVYASGYSMGAMKTWGLGDEFANEFAGIIPTNGCFNTANAKYPNLLMPTFYIAGDSSPLPELPRQKSTLGDDGIKPNTVDARLAALFKLNKVTDKYVFDKNADPVWGIKADKTYKVQSRLYSHVVTTVNLYNSTDGNCYTALAVNSNTGHIVIGESCRAAWDFIKHFTRNADGTITIK
jgi:poly(3-hydroxybutyrate) depolymerase